MGAGVFIPQPYKEVLFKCTQATTAAPAIASRLGDTFGALLGTPTLARTSAGLYTVTMTGKWVVGKTVARAQAYAARDCFPVYTSADVITLQFNDLATPSAADSGDFDLFIRVYD